MKSLQLRLAVLLTLSLVLTFGTLAYALRDFPRYLTEEYVQTRLQHDADSLKGRLTFDAAKNFIMSPGPVAPIYSIPQSGHYYAAKAGNGMVQSGSLGAASLQLDWEQQEYPSTQRSKDESGNPLLVWLGEYRIQGQTVQVAIAEDITHLDQHLDNLQWQYFLGIGLMLALILTLQAFVVRWSLRPIESARQALVKLGRGEIKNIDASVPSEIQPLVDEINRLGQLMQKQMKRSRSAIGNLAHAMKTPISAIQQTISQPDACAPATQKEVQEQLDRVRTSVDRELRRARLSGSGMPGQRFEPQSELPTLIDVLQKIYAYKSLSLVWHSDVQGVLNLDRADLLELIGNLLDNACKWAEHNVRVHIHLGDTLQIEVEDDGPGIDLEQRDNLSGRGVRLDESQPGHGLGLAIVEEIVEDYSGELELAEGNNLGGLKVTIRLPCHPAL